MKKVFRVLSVIALGIAALGLDLTLWKAWRSGHPPLTPIMGAVTRRGVTTADPMIVLCYMTVIFDAAFLASFISLFPSVRMQLKQKKDALWPTVKDPDVDPSWFCMHCHEQNPENFEECWRCQRVRQREGKA